MQSRLDLVRDWERRAQAAGYNAARMSAELGVTPRFVELFFRDRFGTPPHRWMVRVRMERAASLLKEGTVVKAVAEMLAYKRVSHFSREFKRFFGVPPRQFLLRSFSEMTRCPETPISGFDNELRISRKDFGFR